MVEITPSPKHHDKEGTANTFLIKILCFRRNKQECRLTRGPGNHMKKRRQGKEDSRRAKEGLLCRDCGKNSTNANADDSRMQIGNMIDM